MFQFIETARAEARATVTPRVPGVFVTFERQKVSKQIHKNKEQRTTNNNTENYKAKTHYYFLSAHANIKKHTTPQRTTAHRVVVRLYMQNKRDWLV